MSGFSGSHQNHQADLNLSIKELSRISIFYYRKQKFRYMLNAYENFTDPMDIVNILDTIHWVLRAWNHDILPTTINNCFRKNTLAPETVQLPIESPDLTALFAQVQHAGGLKDVMTISNFLNPIEDPETEEVKISGDGLRHPLIANQLPIETEKEHEENETLPVCVLIPKVSEALQAVKLLISYAESQHAAESSTLCLLERCEKDFGRKESFLIATQRTLTRWMA